MSLTQRSGNTFVFEKTQQIELYLETVNEDIDIFKFFTKLTSVKKDQLVGRLFLGSPLWSPTTECGSNPTKVDIGYNSRKWTIECVQTEMEHCFKTEICSILQKDYDIDMINNPDLLAEIELVILNEIVRRGIIELHHKHVFLGNKDTTIQAQGQFSHIDGIFRQLLPFIQGGTTGLVQSVNFATAPVFPNNGTYTPLVAGDGTKILQAIYDTHEKNVLFRKQSKQSKIFIVTYDLYKQYENDLIALGCCSDPVNNPIKLYLEGLGYNGEFLTFKGIPVIYLDEQSEYYSELYAMDGAEFGVLTVVNNLIWGTNEDGIDSRFEVDSRKNMIWSRTKVCLGFNFYQPEFITLALPDGSVYAVGTTPAIGLAPNGLFA